MSKRHPAVASHAWHHQLALKELAVSACWCVFSIKKYMRLTAFPLLAFLSHKKYHYFWEESCMHVWKEMSSVITLNNLWEDFLEENSQVWGSVRSLQAFIFSWVLKNFSLFLQSMERVLVSSQIIAWRHVARSSVPQPEVVIVIHTQTWFSAIRCYLL